MKPFRNLSLGIKVLIPPAILITALGIASLLALYGMDRQRTALQAVNTIALERLNLVDEFVNISDRVQSDVFLISVLRFMNLPKPEIQPIHVRLDQGLSDLNVIYGKISTRWILDQSERSILERMKGPLEIFRLQAMEAAGVVSDDPACSWCALPRSPLPNSGRRWQHSMITRRPELAGPGRSLNKKPQPLAQPSSLSPSWCRCSGHSRRL